MLDRYTNNESGATLAYVALMIVVMLGVVGLSYDLGRHYILSTELQKAADAAAVAGAYQLDIYEDPAIVASRVTEAVQTSPFATNSQKTAASAGTVSIAAVNLLSSIPASDDDPISAANAGPPYNYVEVTTQAVVSNNVFSRILPGQPDTISLQRSAVARKGRAVCQVTPLAVCNPAEAIEGVGAPFKASDYYGRQILVRETGPNSAWVPGNFGFLSVPGFGEGAQGLANALGIGGAPTCFGEGVETEPGQTNGARNALNTRFDLYENPFAKNKSNDPNFAPAENVIKGYDTTGNTSQFCNNPEVADPALLPDIRKLPRDTDLSETNRFGNGQWLCADYWAAVHPGVTAPTGCGSVTGVPTSSITRFQVYRYEIDNGLIPNGSNGTSGTPTETGAPFCSSSTPVSPVAGDLSTDRRIVTMAVLNCLEHNVQGRSDVPAEGYINGFLTEPVNVTPGDPDRGDIVLEVVGSNSSGNGGLAAVRTRDWVEVVR